MSSQEETPTAVCIAALNAIDSDPEVAHFAADEAVQEFLRQTHPDVAGAFRSVVERTRDWWYA